LARRQAGDVRLHHHVVRSADEQQVLHVVPAQQHELALPVEVVDVDDPEPRLPGSVLPEARSGCRRSAAAFATEQHRPEEDDEEEARLSPVRQTDSRCREHVELSIDEAFWRPRARPYHADAGDGQTNFAAG
jgi:hypothetical protein